MKDSPTTIQHVLSTLISSSTKEDILERISTKDHTFYLKIYSMLIIVSISRSSLLPILLFRRMK